MPTRCTTRRPTAGRRRRPCPRRATIWRRSSSRGASGPSGDATPSSAGNTTPWRSTIPPRTAGPRASRSPPGAGALPQPFSATGSSSSAARRRSASSAPTSCSRSRATAGSARSRCERRATARARPQVWSRSGDDEVDGLLALGIEQMSAREGDAAVETFSRVIARRPDFAEGWNRRATAHYLMGAYAKSLADCDEVLKRNPYHFGALSGYGMIYLQLDQPARALEYFARALAVNPNLSSVVDTVEMLKRLLSQRRKDTI